jgi:hypothetical protein
VFSPIKPSIDEALCLPWFSRCTKRIFEKSKNHHLHVIKKHLGMVAGITWPVRTRPRTGLCCADEPHQIASLSEQRPAQMRCGLVSAQATSGESETVRRIRSDNCSVLG